MPGIRANPKFPAQIHIMTRLRIFRRRWDISQEALASEMKWRGHETWFRQTVAMVEGNKRNLTVDELISLVDSLRALTKNKTEDADLVTLKELMGSELDWVIGGSHE